MEKVKLRVVTVADRPLLYSLQHASNLLGVSRATLYKLFAEGTLRKVKVGSKTMIRSSDIDEFIERQTEDDVAQSPPKLFSMCDVR